MFPTAHCLLSCIKVYSQPISHYSNSSFEFSEKIRGLGKKDFIVLTLLRLTFVTSHTGEPPQQHVFTVLLRAEVFSVLLLNCHSVLFSCMQPFVISIAHTAPLSSLQPSQGHCYYFNALDGKEKERVECERGREREDEKGRVREEGGALIKGVFYHCMGKSLCCSCIYVYLNLVPPAIGTSKVAL